MDKKNNMDPEGSRIKHFAANAKAVTIISAICMILLGVMMIISPTLTLLTVCTIVGFLMIAFAAICLILFIVHAARNMSRGVDVLLCIIGAIMLALGIFIVLRPGVVVGFVTLLIAIVLILSALSNFQHMSYLKKYESTRWWLLLITALVTIVLAILVLWNPFASASLLMILMGVDLIFTGICGIIAVIRLIFVAKQYKAAYGPDGEKYVDIDVDELN